MQKNFKIIVTSGPTREFIDPIRFISNPSTGKMGFYIAKAALHIGFSVTYICGPVEKKLSIIEGCNNIAVISTKDMKNAVMKEIKSNSIIIMAAAPADFRAEKKHANKIKKKVTSNISLTHNSDILASANSLIKKENYQNVKLVGFAAETENGYKNALKKLKSKNLDMIFLNNLNVKHSGFGGDTNQVSLILRDKTLIEWEVMAKERLGYKIIQAVEQYLIK